MIHRLSSQVVQEIAAGEVIERPASILKELIENSIDAGATEILIEHLEGGIRLLRVSDNGAGIDPADLPLVFENHATSKLEKLEDFESLSSMGFRGEAMSSIAAVSKISLVSSREIDEHAYRVRIQHGHWLGVEPENKRLGTEVQVEELFHRLPVRQKFLKSANSEARALMQIFKRYALCYPEIAFRLGTAEGVVKEQLQKSNPFERFLWYFDLPHSRRDEFFEVKETAESREFHFMGAKPRYLKPNRLGVQLFLNQRPIKDRSLEFAVRRAFEGFAERTHEVFGCLFLNLSPAEFDINVHPTKSEVRFLNADEVFRFIVGGIRKALERQHLEGASCDTPVSAPAEEFTVREVFVAQERSLPAYSPPKLSWDDGGIKDQAKIIENRIPVFGFQSRFEILGIVERTFLIAKKSEELFLFDQHALHERVLYEELRKEIETKKRIQSQRLLFPATADFENAADLLEHEELLESLGFEIREWKDQRIQILAVPEILKKSYREALLAILDCSVSAKDSILREALATVACHSAIRSHDFITTEEAQKILDQFQSDDALGHCPHGRPTFIRLARRDLEKFFHR